MIVLAGFDWFGLFEAVVGRLLRGLGKVQKGFGQFLTDFGTQLGTPNRLKTVQNGVMQAFLTLASNKSVLGIVFYDFQGSSWEAFWERFRFEMLENRKRKHF